MNERHKARRMAGLPAKASDFAVLALDAALLLTLAMLTALAAVLATHGYVPLPVDWIQQRIQKADIGGIRLECGEMGLTLDGTVRIENPVVFLQGVDKPVLEATEVTVRFRWRDFSFVPEPDTLVVTDGTLFLPAIHSPDGQRMAVLERCVFKLKLDEEQYRLEAFGAQHLDIALRGSLTWPRTAALAEEARQDIREVFDRFFALLARGTRETHQLSAYEQPTFFFNLGRNGAGEIVGPVSLSSSRASSQGIEAEDVGMHTQVRVVDGALIQAAPLVVHADRLSRPGSGIEIRTVTGRAAEGEWNRFFAGEPVDLHLAAASLTQGHLYLEAPVLTYTPESLDVVRFRGSAGGYGGAFTFRGRSNLRKGSLEVMAHGGLDVLGVLPGSVSKRIMAAKWREPPFIRMGVRFDDGFALQEAEFNLQSGVTSIESVDFDDIHLTGSFRDGRIVIDDFLIAREPQWVEGSLSFDTRTRAYQAAFRGSIVPRNYNAIMPSWWARMFKDVRFEQPGTNYADFVLRGHLDDGANRFIFGSFDGRDLLYDGIPLDRGSLKVRARGRQVELFDLETSGPGGTLNGRITTTSRPDDKPSALSMRYAIEGNLTLETLRALVGGGTAKLIGDFESDHPVRLSASGVNFRTRYYPEFKGLDEVNVEASTEHRIIYSGALLDSLSLKLRSIDGSTHLRDVRFGFGGGTGNADVDILHPPDGPGTVRLLGYLDDADRHRVATCIGQLFGDGDEEAHGAPDAAADEAAPTRLDLDLHVEVPTDDPAGATGFGRLFLEDPDLGAINLLGPVSRLLSGSAVFGFTTLTLDTASTAFVLADRRITFEDIRIVGPSLRVAMNGAYHMDDGTLAFGGFIHPLGNTQDRGFPRRAIGRLLSPISRVFSFRLTGTLDNPRARSVLDPRNLVPGL